MEAIQSKHKDVLSFSTNLACVFWTKFRVYPVWTFLLFYKKDFQKNSISILTYDNAEQIDDSLSLVVGSTFWSSSSSDPRLVLNGVCFEFPSIVFVYYTLCTFWDVYAISAINIWRPDRENDLWKIALSSSIIKFHLTKQLLQSCSKKFII